MSAARDSDDQEAAEFPVPLPPALARNAPLVPGDATGGRALAGVIAILTFLAALCAVGAELVAASSAEWQAGIAREVTIQVRPGVQRDVEADVARAAELARRTAGIEAVHPYSKAESERLLEPWLGSGLSLSELPVPRLIVLRLAEGSPPDLGELRRGLRAEVPGASLDDHGIWLSRLSTMAGTVVAVGVGVVLLVLAAAALAVTFATRGAMASSQGVVEVLHFVGAEDDFIAREFQRRFFRLGLRGAALGAAGALAATALLGILARSWRASPAGDQIEALFGAFAFGWRGFAVVILVALVASGLTGIVSRLTVRRFLRAAA